MQGTASHDVLLRFCSACFVKLGMPSEDAALTADNLVFASLRGVDSHGVMRMKIYADRMRARGTDPRARPRVLSESAVHVLLDGGDGVGQVATAEAMRRVIAKAREAAELGRKVPAAPPPPFTALPGAPPVVAGGYADIAQKTLFDRSRNPTVAVELPPAPPPVPMPPLPAFRMVSGAPFSK